MTNIETKKWYQSSTLWINLIGVVAVVLDLVVKTNLIPDADVVTIIVAVLNILNRFRAPTIVKPIEKNLI